MILPSKGVHPRQALLTIGGEILDVLDEPMTVSKVWAVIRGRRASKGDVAIGFDWFVLALDLLCVLDVVVLGEDGFLSRKVR